MICGYIAAVVARSCSDVCCFMLCCLCLIPFQFCRRDRYKASEEEAQWSNTVHSSSSRTHRYSRDDVQHVEELVAARFDCRAAGGHHSLPCIAHTQRCSAANHQVHFTQRGYQASVRALARQVVCPQRVVCSSQVGDVPARVR